MSMTLASQFGYIRTLRFILGIAVGFFVLMLLCGYFNLAIFRLIPKIKRTMTILGSLYMLYLAFKIMKTNSKREKRSQDGLNSFFFRVCSAISQSERNFVRYHGFFLVYCSVLQVEFEYCFVFVYFGFVRIYRSLMLGRLRRPVSEIFVQIRKSIQSDDGFAFDLQRDIDLLLTNITLLQLPKIQEACCPR